MQGRSTQSWRCVIECDSISTALSSRMPDSDIQDNSTQEPSKQEVVHENDSRTSSVAASPQKAKGRGIAVLALLFSVAALGASGYQWYRDHFIALQGKSTLAVDLTEISGNISRIHDNVNRLEVRQAGVVTQEELVFASEKSGRSLEQAVAAMDLRIESALEKIGQARQEQLAANAELQRSLAQLGEELESDKKNYYVDEAAHLLRLANHSLLFAANVESARTALSLADSLIRATNDPSLSEVRQIISTEVAQLRSFAGVDIEGISASLLSLRSEISKLPLANEPQATVIQSNVEDASAEETSIRSELGKVWHDLKNAIRVQRVDQPPKPLLVPEQRYFLDQNIELKLNQAALAVLDSRAGVFVHSLQDAETWLKEYFDLASPAVQGVVDEVARLRATNIIVQPPDISGSYTALSAVRGE